MDSLQGQFLLATPTLLDPNFAQSVVLMVQHSEEGALGLVLNRPTDVTIDQAWEATTGESCERTDLLYRGGPCDGPLMLVHNCVEASEVRVAAGVHFSAEKHHVEWLIRNTSESMRMFVGYSGWGASQLEEEMRSGSWLALPADAATVFAEDASVWKRLLQRAKPDLGLGSLNPKLIPRDPSLN